MIVIYILTLPQADDAGLFDNVVPPASSSASPQVLVTWYNFTIEYCGTLFTNQFLQALLLPDLLLPQSPIHNQQAYHI